MVWLILSHRASIITRFPVATFSVIPWKQPAGAKNGWFKVEKGTLGYCVCTYRAATTIHLLLQVWRVTSGEKHFELRRGQDCLTLAYPRTLNGPHHVKHLFSTASWPAEWRPTVCLMPDTLARITADSSDVRKQPVWHTLYKPGHAFSALSFLFFFFAL